MRCRILGERAYGLALASALPAAIKDLFTQAKPYAEGRGIRLALTSADERPPVFQLVELKTTPR